MPKIFLGGPVQAQRLFFIIEGDLIKKHHIQDICIGSGEFNFFKGID